MVHPVVSVRPRKPAAFVRFQLGTGRQRGDGRWDKHIEGLRHEEGSIPCIFAIVLFGDATEDEHVRCLCAVSFYYTPRRRGS
jgi:hypothetical protein